MNVNRAEQAAPGSDTTPESSSVGQEAQGAAWDLLKKSLEKETLPGGMKVMLAGAKEEITYPFSWLEQ